MNFWDWWRDPETVAYYERLRERFFKDSMNDIPRDLAPDFGDPETLLNSRDWLRKAIEAGGAKVVGGGIGGGQADLSFTLEGCEFSVSLRPVIR